MNLVGEEVYHIVIANNGILLYLLTIFLLLYLLLLFVYIQYAYVGQLGLFIIMYTFWANKSLLSGYSKK